jgi:hypothetical protein
MISQILCFEKQKNLNIIYDFVKADSQGVKWQPFVYQNQQNLLVG